MSCGSQNQNACVIRGSDASILARMYRQSDGELLTAVEIDRIQQTVYDMADPSTPIDQRDLDIGAVFFDVLQLDARWTLDEIGFNFDTTIPGAWLMGSINRVEVVFYMKSGATTPLDPYTIQTKPLLSV